MGKRTNTASWVESAGRWQINVQKDGIRKTFTCAKPGKIGKQEANRKADEWLDEGISNQSAKVSALYDQFLESLKIRTSVSNWKKFESFGRTRLNPAIGNKRIGDVTEQQLQSIIDRAYRDGLSRKTLRNMLDEINAFFKYCRMCRVCSTRPEFLSVPAGARYKGHTIIQPDGLVTLFSSDTTILRGKRVKDGFINAYRLSVLTGMRPGELRGLRWQDVDGDTIHVRGAINRENEHTKGKNENAIRDIVLPDLAKAVIDNQRNETLGMEYVFYLGSMQNYNRRWTAYSAANGIPHTSLYEMRHTFVSVCKTLPEGQLKAIVGHSAEMDTFGVYGHALNGESQRTAVMVNSLFLEVMKSKKR